MSRHRNVRTMNYDEDYEGYDDVYGHSVEDDYCVSPGTSHYLYDRSHETTLAYFSPEPLKEEDEADAAVALPRRRHDSITHPVQNLNADDRAKLNSCIDQIYDVVGDSVTDQVITNAVLDCNFDWEKALDVILSNKMKDVSLEERPEDLTAVISNKLTDVSLNAATSKPLLEQQDKKDKGKAESSPSLASVASTHVHTVAGSQLGALAQNHLSSVDSSSSFKVPQLGQGSLLNSLAQSHLSPLGKKFSSDTSLLGTLAQDHLKSKDSSSGFIIPKLGISPGLNNLRNPLTSADENDSKPFIDLTQALRKSKSVGSTVSHVDRKKKSIAPKFQLLIVSNVWDKNNGMLIGRPSSFARILGIHWKRKAVIKSFKKQQKALFNFDVPSPDDKILQHLRKTMN